MRRLHSLLKRSLGLLPLNSVHKLCIDFLILSEINKRMWIHPSTDLDHTVLVVKNLKLDVLGQTVSPLFTKLLFAVDFRVFFVSVVELVWCDNEAITVQNLA